MPSRAVLRKKARRELRRRKLDIEKVTVALTRGRQNEKEEEPQQKEKEEKVRLTEGREKMSTLAPIKRLHAAVVMEKSVETAPTTEGMSHKERKRFEAKRRLERQLDKLGATTATETITNTNTNSDGGNAEPPACSQALRHDPQFKNGTFWRTRKERRERTVFLGNMPGRFTVRDVEDFVSSMVDASTLQNDKESVEMWGAPVDSVDFLQAKPRAKHRHMFVTLRSKEIAEHVIKLLNSYQLEGAALRCNFAADKTQRSEAISRRSGMLPGF